MWKYFCPDRYVKSILEIDTGLLQARGIKGVIVDMDNTIIPYHQRQIDARVQEWMEQMKEQGFKLCIVSNNTAVQGEELARQLDIPAVWYAVKPRRRAFRKALHQMGLSAGKVAVVGDQVFTDVLGGNRLGMYTVLVVPLSQKEMFWTKAVRAVERKILQSLQNRGLLEKI